MLVRRCSGLASCSCCGARNSASASGSTRLSRRRPLPCVRPAVVTGSPHTGSAPPATRTLLRFYHHRGHPPAAWAAAPLQLQLPSHQASRLGRGLASSSSSGHPKAADEGAVEAAPAAADPGPEALGVAAAEADASAEAAAPPVAPSGYTGERNLGRDFYNKRFRLLLNHVVESGPPLTEPALLHDQERWSLPSFQWKVAVVNFMNHAFLRPEETLGDQYLPILYALDDVPGSAFGALHNAMQGWQAKARMHKFAVDGAKPALPELPPEFLPARNLLLPFILRYVTPPTKAAAIASSTSISGISSNPTTPGPAPAHTAASAAGAAPFPPLSPATAPTAILPSAAAAGAGPHHDTLLTPGEERARGSVVDASMVRQLVRVCDMRLPHEWYPYARIMRRKVIYHGGPTNSGKTYHALQRLKAADPLHGGGAYLGPLRLLALEVYDRLNEEGVYCSLLTGQEKRIVPFAEHISATVEMVNLANTYDVAVIDEIQMIGDSERGHAWTRALLGLRAREIHLCGGPEAIDVVTRLCQATGDDLEYRDYERMTELNILEEPLGDYSYVQAGDCVVAFSKADICSIKQEIEAKTSHKCCMVYGSLPSETRADQAKIFNAPDTGYDVLVASDAIGMGLNLNIKRIIFHSLMKSANEGGAEVLHSGMIKQIAGRAGRRSSRYPNGEVTCYKGEDMVHLRAGLNTPTQRLVRAGLFPTAEQLEDFALLLQSQIESPGQQQQQAMMLNPSAAVAAAGASASASAAGRARQANGGGGSSSSLEKGSQERLQEEGEVNGAEAAAVDGGHNEGEEEGEGQGAWRPAGVWVTHSPLKWEADGWMAGWLPRKPGVGNGHRAEGAAGGGWDWDGEGRPGARGAEGGRRTGAKDRGQAAATAAAAAAAAAAEASEALQRELGLMEVMDSFFSMAEVSSTYFMCRSRSMAAIASYLAQLQPLSIAERYVLCSVPVNVRDRLAMQMLYQFAAARAARRPMPLAIRLPREPPRTLLGMNELCTKNSVLDAYLWLSHKFPSTFVQREAALEMRQSCIGLLEEGIKLGMTVEHDHAERDAVLRRQYAMRLERLRAKGAPLTAPGLPTAAPLPSEIPGPILAADSSPSPSAAPGETEAEAAEAAAASLESASSLGAVRTEEDDGYENDDEEAMVERELEVAEDEKERAALLASEDPAVLGLDEHKEKGGGGGGQ